MQRSCGGASLGSILHLTLTLLILTLLLTHLTSLANQVSDFGLSRVLGANKNHIKTQTFGTVTHVPPELLAKGTLSAKADVYAIGVLLWEIYTAEKVCGGGLGLPWWGR